MGPFKRVWPTMKIRRRLGWLAPFIRLWVQRCIWTTGQTDGRFNRLDHDGRSCLSPRTLALSHLSQTPDTHNCISSRIASPHQICLGWNITVTEEVRRVVHGTHDEYAVRIASRVYDWFEVRLTAVQSIDTRSLNYCCSSPKAVSKGCIAFNRYNTTLPLLIQVVVEVDIRQLVGHCRCMYTLKNVLFG